jgi:hypothetical protein
MSVSLRLEFSRVGSFEQRSSINIPNVPMISDPFWPYRGESDQFAYRLGTDDLGAVCINYAGLRG